MFVLLSGSLMGQQVINKIDSIKYSYCEIYTKDAGLGGRFSIEINFGDRSEPFSEKTYKSPVYPDVFIGLINALNYMGKGGWEVVQVYTVLIGSSSLSTYSYHYLLKKRIE